MEKEILYTSDPNLMCAVKNMIAINLFQCIAARFFFIRFIALLYANFKPAFPYNNQTF